MILSAAGVPFCPSLKLYWILQINKMNLQSFLRAIPLTISSLLLASISAQAITVSGTFSDANAWQDALNNNTGQDFSLEHRSLAGLDCSPYTNGGSYATLSNFCNTGINSQLQVNDILSDPEATLTPTNVTSHGITGSGYSVSYGNTGKTSIAVQWTFPEDVQGLFLDFTSSAFTKDTQIAITGADGGTEVVAVPNGSDTWGFVTNTAISAVEFFATQNGDENFSVASVSLATNVTNDTTEVPSPVVIPGLLGLGVIMMFRKRKRAAAE